MENLRLTQALYEMMEQDIDRLEKEIKILQENGCTYLLQLLENIV